MADRLRVSVVFAQASGQVVRELELPRGASVADALAASGLGERARAAVGVFGRTVEPGTALRDGDRVEIYRPLRIDPKEARRRRAATKTDRR
jgi:putative ubiquitin-RnfH superfamily antitoxin RatB of RatAB toxin-antitoxin module